MSILCTPSCIVCDQVSPVSQNPAVDHLLESVGLRTDTANGVRISILLGSYRVLEIDGLSQPVGNMLMGLGLVILRRSGYSLFIWIAKLCRNCIPHWLVSFSPKCHQDVFF